MEKTASRTLSRFGPVREFLSSTLPLPSLDLVSSKFLVLARSSVPEFQIQKLGQSPDIPFARF